MTFPVGVNYWPARTAMGWWRHFDATEVRRDFARIGAAGLDSVRIFLTWEDFQPSPTMVNSAQLQNLVDVANLATDTGLALMPTLFTGHMSGANWIPGWALEPRETPQRFRVVTEGSTSARTLRSWFTDPEIVAAQALLARESARALAGHPALWAWDLGNENSNCVVPPDRASGRAWLEQMTDAIRGADGTAAVTIGLHMEDLEEDRRIGPAEAAAYCDFLTMHGYPIYAPWADGPTDAHLLGFLTRVTRWLGGGADVVFTEFGMTTSLVDEAAAAAFTDRALRDLQIAGAKGAMLWCANDYDPSIWDSPPLDDAAHERSFGMWRADGTPKPSVAAVTNCPLDLPPAEDTGWLDIEPDEFYTNDGSHLARLYQRYRRDGATAGSTG
ncbi:MAG: cellulase family glycosylhydrolase [Acidimicrobiales bacterium]